MATRYGRRRCSKKSIAAKQSASRRVSTMTTAPIAPRTSSSHMNQNRVCPGVPNRYRIRSRSIEMRPKSIATVVVVLPGTCRLSSTPTPADVMIASVVSGVISDTEPTSVVLPTPKPPAMTIFAEVTRPGLGRCDISEPPKSTQHPFQQLSAYCVIGLERGRLVDRDKSIRGHVRDEDPSHSQRQLHPRRDLGQGLQPPVAQRRDVLVLPALRTFCRLSRPAAHGGLDQRLDRDFQPGPGATTGNGVRPNQRAGRFISFHHLAVHPLPNPEWTIHPGLFVPSSAEHPRSGPRRRRQRVSDPVHQQRHLVAHLADVATARREHRERRTIGN